MFSRNNQQVATLY